MLHIFQSEQAYLKERRRELQIAIRLASTGLLSAQEAALAMDLCCDAGPRLVIRFSDEHKGVEALPAIRFRSGNVVWKQMQPPSEWIASRW